MSCNNLASKAAAGYCIGSPRKTRRCHHARLDAAAQNGKHIQYTNLRRYCPDTLCAAQLIGAPVCKALLNIAGARCFVLLAFLRGIGPLRTGCLGACCAVVGQCGVADYIHSKTSTDGTRNKFNAMAGVPKGMKRTPLTSLEESPGAPSYAEARPSSEGLDAGTGDSRVVGRSCLGGQAHARPRHISSSLAFSITRLWHARDRLGDG